ncbi:MAG: hypothetical protein LBR07_10560 [Puniceicoccales bacterium]|jgi:hypothetical protein|nr:hypothetical protein [Puniceicoccales bacterium]
MNSPTLPHLPLVPLLAALLSAAPAAAVKSAAAGDAGDNAAAIVRVPLPAGGAFYFAIRDRLLFLSTNRGELLRALDAKSTGNALSRADEFRVMRAKLPPTAATRAYVYLSDPFIRRLTSPAVKIGQLRRANTAAVLARLSALALLHRRDTGTDPASIADLKNAGYLDADAPLEDEFSLAPGCVAVSNKWGRLAALTTLEANPATTGTAQEIRAYSRYRNNYASFWRQYFDPIAIRLDVERGRRNANRISLETYILPLLDNSLYNALAATLNAAGPPRAIMPEFATQPVATLAFSLPAADTRGQGAQLLREITQFDHWETLNRHLTGEAVIAVGDAAPVIQMWFPGLTRFSEATGLGRRDPAEFLIAPVVAALLTRPCDLALRVKRGSTGIVQDLLRSLESRNVFDWLRLEVGEYSPKQLLLTFTLAGAARFELGVSLEGEWLHFSNHPWNPNPIRGTARSDSGWLRPAGTGAAARGAHAALELVPSQIRAGQEQAFTAANLARRNSLYADAAALAPWIFAYGCSPDEAVRLRRAALGESPTLPADATLQLVPATGGKKPAEKTDSSARLTLTSHGSWLHQRNTPVKYDYSDPGFFGGIHSALLWLRFEDTGLRTRLELQTTGR